MKNSYLSYLIELLQSDEWKDVSHDVEIAKGKYKIPQTWNEFLKRR
tara:strand:- start:3256 stop:3393 length:138 start_codon:yes stop_codon:yes gene_type:complete